MPAERDHPFDLDPLLVRAFSTTFIARTDCYPLQLEDGGYAIVKKPFSLGNALSHLRGLSTVGAFALDETNHAQWLCFDADTEQQWKRLVYMARMLDTQRVTSYLELSRRGGHLWLFTERAPGRDLRRFGKQLMTDYSIEGVELYPKQDELRTGPGSFVRLPFGVHRVTQRRYHFITLRMQPLAPTIRVQMALLAHPKRVPPEFFNHILSRAPVAEPALPTPPFAPLLEIAKRSRKNRNASDGLPSERIKAAMSVAEFVGHYVTLDHAGRGHCPFHDDEHMSFAVSDQGNYWHCFAGCGGGSIIDFWMMWRKTHGHDDSFTATITELADMLLD